MTLNRLAAFAGDFLGKAVGVDINIFIENNLKHLPTKWRTKR